MKISKDIIFASAITMWGAFFRLYKLGNGSLQIDNIILWDDANRNLSIAETFSSWLQNTGLTGQLPLAPAISSWFIRFFNLELNFTSLLLPFAIMGIICIPIAYAIGRILQGRSLAALFAFFMALQPMIIQMSREAYFYIPAFLGSMLALLALTLSRNLIREQKVPWLFHVANALAFFIMTWSSPSTWTWAFLFSAYHGIYFLCAAWKSPRLWGHFIILAATYLIIGLPLLFAEWGLPQLQKFTSDGATRDYWLQIFGGGRSESSFAKLWPVLRSYAWGATWLRGIISLLVIMTGFSFAAMNWCKHKTYTIIASCFLIILFANILAVQKSVWIFGITRIVPIVPHFLLIISLGTLFAMESITRTTGTKYLQWCLPLLLIGLWLPPAWWVTQSTGNPKPFQAAATWADQNLPEDMPIITERFFTAYNEFRVHPAQYVHFFSIAPNQISAQYRQNQFRAKTERFIQNSPVSALYLENHLWHIPEIGPWQNLDMLFARKAAITNTAGMKLGQLGLEYRGHGKVETNLNRYVCTFLYNLPEDLADKAQADGASTLALFASGWRPVTTQDMRSWRLMQDKAFVDVWNFSDTEQTVTLLVQAVAPGQNKRIVINGRQSLQFPANQLINARVSIPEIPPGKSTITFSDQSPPSPLLFAMMTVEKE